MVMCTKPPCRCWWDGDVQPVGGAHGGPCAGLAHPYCKHITSSHQRSFVHSPTARSKAGTTTRDS